MTTTFTSTKYKGIKNSEIKYMDAFRTYFFLVIGAFLMIIPLIWMLFSALKTPAQFLTTQLSLAMPENPQWKNFTQRVWEMNPKLQLGILNSIIISFSTIIVGSFVSSLAAFAYSKLHFPGKNKLFLAELATMMIPFAVIMIPQFIMYARIGWLNTWYPLMIPGMLGNVSMIFFLRQYMSGIPTSIVESARIDGAGFFRIYWQIILPNAKPAIAAQAILWFMGAWNDYFAPSIYLNEPKKLTVQVMISQLNAMYAIQTDYPLLLTASLIALLPVLIIFMIFQKQIIASVAMTGLK
ncbi:ABC-type sugar transport system, permease component [Treponema sp. JC4]|uniref:carbohydrate ABC transporter permease n=1 Tax=Treponema sp. JC4 TaxID=1124982 RepID=UPI00025B0C8B|nr:carbohydrate ABC transporter permease [Treponema sp. JC4]EID84606.1 ABC-type sugar transport system, permease component [Treponema sp. JC4]